MIMMMKTYYFVLALAMAFAVGCTSTESGAYRLTGSLEGVPEGTVALSRMNESDRTWETIDSTTFENGSFTLQGKLAQAEFLRLTINPGNWSVSLFVEPGEQAIKVDTAGAEHYDYTAYGGGIGAAAKTFTVTGSSSQDVLTAFKQAPEQQGFDARFAVVNQRYEAAPDKDAKEAVRAEYKTIADEQYRWQIQWIDSFTVANPASVVGAYLLENYYRFNRSMPLAELDAKLAVFRVPADTSPYAMRLREIAAKRRALQPGNAAPDFTLLRPDSTSFSLSSTRGKYVLIDFWASWCVPCREAIPHWKEAYAKYHDKGFEIVGVTNDSRWPDWFKALDVERMPWIQVADDFPVKNMPARVAELYMIPFLPTYVLLDREGRVILHEATKDQVDERLAALLD